MIKEPWGAMIAPELLQPTLLGHRVSGVERPHRSNIQSVILVGQRTLRSCFKKSEGDPNASATFLRNSTTASLITIRCDSRSKSDIVSLLSAIVDTMFMPEASQSLESPWEPAGESKSMSTPTSLNGELARYPCASMDAESSCATEASTDAWSGIAGLCGDLSVSSRIALGGGSL